MDKIYNNLLKLSSIKENIRLAINNKGIECSTNEPFNNYPIKINNIQTQQAQSSLDLSDVNFWDLNGNIVYRYTASEFQNLTEFPTIPAESGLIAQCWNWTLADAKEHVLENQFLDIGPNYITDTGDTRIYLEIDDSFVNVPFTPCITYDNTPTANRKVYLDWGDGSELEQFSTAGVPTLTHTYTQKGSYVMRFIVADNNAFFYLGITTSYPSLFGYWYQSPKEFLLGAITRVEIGKNVKGSGRIGGAKTTFLSIPNYGNYFQLYGSNGNINNVRSLKVLCLPKTITSLSASSALSMILLKAFLLPKSSITSFTACASTARNCKVINIPNNYTTISASAFDYSYNLKRLSIPSSVTSIGNYAFRSCSELEQLKLHSGLLTIGTGAFTGCSKLEEIILPNTVTSIGGDAFRSCINCKNIIISTSLTSIPTYAFAYNNATTITIPNSVTSIGSYAFAHSYSLKTLIFNEGLQTIDQHAFRNTYFLEEIIIPSTVTNIGSSAFWINTSHAQKDFTVYMLPTTPPTLGTSVFNQRNSNNKTLRIIVPQGTLADYQTASNWSTYASYMEEDVPISIEP